MVRLRTSDTYEVERNGKHIRAVKRMEEDVTELVARAVQDVNGEILVPEEEVEELTEAEENLVTQLSAVLKNVATKEDLADVRVYLEYDEDDAV